MGKVVLTVMSNLSVVVDFSVVVVAFIGAAVNLVVLVCFVVVIVFKGFLVCSSRA